MRDFIIVSMTFKTFLLNRSKLFSKVLATEVPVSFFAGIPFGASSEVSWMLGDDGTGLGGFDEVSETDSISKRTGGKPELFIGLPSMALRTSSVCSSMIFRTDVDGPVAGRATLKLGW